MAIGLRHGARDVRVDPEPRTSNLLGRRANVRRRAGACAGYDRCVRSSGLLLLSLLGACTFAWDELDPRGVGNQGGSGGLAGGGAATSSTVASTSSIGGAGGTGGSGGANSQVTLMLGERPTCDLSEVTEDTNLDQGGQAINFGASGAMQVDINDGIEVRALLRFRLSALPAGAQIAAAELRLVTADGPNAGSAGAVQFYALAEDWTEGNEVGSFGVANWIQRQAGEAWASPGAGTASRGSSPIASVVMSMPSTEYVVPIPTSLAQAWFDDPDRNFGMVLEVETADGVTISSSDASIELSRPVMVVTFVPP